MAADGVRNTSLIRGESLGRPTDSVSQRYSRDDLHLYDSQHRHFGQHWHGRIFVYSGAPTGGITLNSGEWLVGQGVTGTDFDTVMGITPPPGTIARPAINGTRPVIQNTVTLAGSAVVKGLNILAGRTLA